MVELTGRQILLAEPFFEGNEETMIWSCLDGSMGRAWADALPPRSVQIVTGCFGFFGGVPSRELAGHIPPEQSYLLAVCPGDWDPLFQELRGEPLTRYALRKDTRFDRKQLEDYRSRLPEGYALRRIDGDLYPILMGEAWSADFCGNFRDRADYLRRGRGFVVMHGGQPVAGASSFTVYRGGIEIEIATKPEHRRKGLALSCGAALILDCLDAGLYPSWDAGSLASASLAEKLGYRQAGAYPAWLLQKHDAPGE